MGVREWLQKRKETLSNFGFGVIQRSGQLAIYLSEWQTWWMALFMLLCIKRQFWHWLVIFTEVYKKLKFNLKEKEGRDQRRLASWQSAKTRDGAKGILSGWFAGQRWAGDTAVWVCVCRCALVWLMYLGGIWISGALKVHSACANPFIEMNVGVLLWKDANGKYTWELGNVFLHIYVEKL